LAAHAALSDGPALPVNVKLHHAAGRKPQELGWLTTKHCAKRQLLVAPPQRFGLHEGVEAETFSQVAVALSG